MIARRLFGATILAGLVGLVAVQVPECLRLQRRQPFDRSITLRPELDIEALAAKSRSEIVRFRYGLWYWLARELPGGIIRVTPGSEWQTFPLRGLGDVQVLEWNRPRSLELTSKAAAKLRERATHQFRLADGGRLYLLKDLRASEYILMTRNGAPHLLLPRDQLRGPRPASGPREQPTTPPEAQQDGPSASAPAPRR